ncbi:alpha-1-acid glycoprotein 3 isoform X2 [Mus musculus]|uniref:alpha-1-acid glycoprotein 3 isoform X2 n=1 Tax=Mus musculus TaxID=10090 RepID=UPI0003D74AE2|nr:alpha-1-acid glycoprotein 3 isoform X2 [Mus musculus]|eukprot:XP_006537730.1 PREDICTED: alpha-1-acid glycoprotein 3 isoform X2 [Mus musculus]
MPRSSLQGLLICVPASPQLSGKWFLIAVADSDPDYRQEIQKVQTIFFYLTLNLINDTMELREYHTKDDHCVYNSNLLGFQRENGTLFKYGEEGEVETLLHLRVLEKHGAIMLFFDLKDEKKRGLSLSARRPDIPPELREVFQKAVTHVGMDESEIIFVDWKKVNEEAVRYHPSSAPSVSDPRGSERASFWLRQLSEAGILLTLLPPVRAESHRDPRWAVSLKKVRLSRRF